MDKQDIFERTCSKSFCSSTELIKIFLLFSTDMVTWNECKWITFFHSQYLLVCNSKVPTFIIHLKEGSNVQSTCLPFKALPIWWGWTLLYFKWIINNDLLYVAQGTLLNVIRQPGLEGVWGRMDTCIGMAESLCCPLETVTTLLISYTSIPNKNV